MKQIYSLILSLASVLTANAQNVTYNHDATKMNQFLMQETGAGSFQKNSEWYYTLLHNSYKKSIQSTNKSLYRTATYEASYLQVDYADSIRSRLEARAKEEAVNMADRQLDVAWLTEQSKIENALSKYRNNLSLLSANGASSAERDDWKQYTDMYDFAISRTKDAYMANSERQKEYLTIYKDITARNTRLVMRLRYLRALKGSNEVLDASPNQRHGRVLQCVNESYNKWRDAGSSVRTNSRNQ